MLEILFLIRFVRHLSRLAKSKGRSGGWGGLGVAFWFGGELMGFIVGGIADLGAGSYLLALVFAACGATASHFIVKGLRSESLELPDRMPVPAPGSFVTETPDLTNPYARPRAG